MSLLSRLAVQAARAYGILSSADKTKVVADYLVVAGGGGGNNDSSGGGGAGGFQTSTFTLSTLNTYSIAVGAGGAYTTNGANSSVSGTGLTTVTSVGGGRAGGSSGGYSGASGGSGGGGSGGSSPNAGGAGTSGQGNAGGNGNSSSPFTGGGGGGASAAGSAGGSNGGNGGAGTASSISGSSVTYAGGGGGNGGLGSAGTGGAGGGGNGGSAANQATATSGTANTGGGAGGGNSTYQTSGGSGIVIISYTSATPKFVGGTITTSGGKQIHTFTSSGTLSPITPITANYLVVAGGGGGGKQAGGGGGAGGLQTGSTTLYSGGTYIVTVGAGGSGQSGAPSTASGSNSVLSGIGLTTLTSVGGGGGAGVAYTPLTGANGGSGGGGWGGYSGGTATSGQGNNGGVGVANSSFYDETAGGGGGAGAVGGNGTSSTSGNGGAGYASSISGTSTYYAGGGGAGGPSTGAAADTYGTGGSGGGANGGRKTAVNGSSGTPNSGGGGGGGSYSGQVGTVGNGGSGGSGIVIISYAGSQQFNGGLVTTSGGNTIHTFTSSGALTPLTNNLNNSLRFRSSALASLSRTPTVVGNRQKWTWSAWIKRGTLSAGALYFNGGTVGSNTYTNILDNGQTLGLNNAISGTGLTISCKTAAVFRDPSAWYHFVVAVDTTQATNANGVKIYVNGNQQTLTFTAYTQNTNTQINNTVTQDIAQLNGYTSELFDGYMADINFVDGQQLEPYYFGNNDANGVWKPIQYKGTYGTNGFYLTFGNTTSTTTLGYDSSPNGNNWTCNNISLTAGTTYDAMLDVPTNTSATVANYAVWNPLSPTGATCADGNLQATLSTSGKWAVGTFAVSSGKYYFECVLGGGTPELAIGIAPNSATTANSNALHYYSLDGKVYSSNSVVATGATFTSGDIIGVAFEPGGNAYFYKNNTLQATVSMPAGSDWCAETYQTAIKTNTATINFGQRPFTYTPPTGYVALNTYNLLTPTILQGNKYMDATLYTGTGTSQVTVNAGQFKPDFVWLKSRSNAYNNELYDSVRGVQKRLVSNLTNAESTSTNGLTAFNSNGFTQGGEYETGLSGNYVGWQWQAGQGSTSSNTSGSITSTVSVNTTAGFSIVTYTGTGANATVGHGLGVAPKLIICKNRTDVITWLIYHSSLGATKYLEFNTSAAVTATPAWNNTEPTSSVFTVGTYTNNNGSGKAIVAYCWAEIAGFSKFGSYTGNGSSDGPFIATNFRPKFVMIKVTSTTNVWLLIDATRNPYNVTNLNLNANDSSAENTASTGAWLDFTSNGFKIRNGSDSAINSNGATYVYACFASHPFKNSNAV